MMVWLYREAQQLRPDARVADGGSTDWLWRRLVGLTHATDDNDMAQLRGRFR